MMNKMSNYTGRVTRSAMLLLALASPLVFAASAQSEANAQYQSERAVCMNGQSNQDRATCLKEASAALAEARRGQLGNSNGAFRANATIRCNALPSDQRDACMMRMEGAGTVSGSARDGGVIRELRLPDRK